MYLSRDPFLAPLSYFNPDLEPLVCGLTAESLEFFRSPAPHPSERSIAAPANQIFMSHTNTLQF